MIGYAFGLIVACSAIGVFFSGQLTSPPDDSIPQELEKEGSNYIWNIFSDEKDAKVDQTIPEESEKGFWDMFSSEKDSIVDRSISEEPEKGFWSIFSKELESIVDETISEEPEKGFWNIFSSEKDSTVDQTIPEVSKKGFWNIFSNEKNSMVDQTISEEPEKGFWKIFSTEKGSSVDQSSDNNKISYARFSRRYRLMRMWRRFKLHLALDIFSNSFNFLLDFDRIANNPAMMNFIWWLFGFVCGIFVSRYCNHLKIESDHEYSHYELIEREELPQSQEKWLSPENKKMLCDWAEIHENVLEKYAVEYYE